jgi:hypothetical protein
MADKQSDSKVSDAAVSMEKVDEQTVLELLEEDDEFEEFEGSKWETAEAEEGQLWKVSFMCLNLYIPTLRVKCIYNSCYYIHFSHLL